MLAQMRLVGVLAGGIDDQEQMVAEIRDHQIVQDAAVDIGELGIALPACGQRQDVLRHHLLQRKRSILRRAGARPQRELAHVRNIEQSGPLAGMEVFLQHAGGILHGHVIARERHHLGAELHVQVVEGSAFQRSSGLHAQASRGPLWVPGTIPEKPIEAPSVAVPESIIPSADALRLLEPSAPLSRCCPHHAVLLPESFRGGCSFGAGQLADLSRRGRLEQIGGKHDVTKPVNAARGAINGL